MKPGSAAVVIDRWSLAEELWSFGEDALYLVVLDMSDSDMIRLWELAGTLLPDARSGGEAAVLAAVALVEGRRRSLARERRRPRSELPTFAQTPDQRNADVHRIRKAASWPHPWD